MWTVLVCLALQAPAASQAEAPALEPEQRAAFESAAASALAEGCLALVIRREGEVVFERYAEGSSAEDPIGLSSATKSFWPVALAAAIDDGLLRADERVSDTVTSWKNARVKEAASVSDLLQLVCGLDANYRPLRKSWTEDLHDSALKADVVAELGTTFANGPTAFFVFGALLQAKLGEEDLLAWLERRVFDPIGLEITHWSRDKAGKLHMPYGAYTSARGWSALGQLILDGGKLGERQLISAEALASVRETSSRNPSYAMGLWDVRALDRIGQTATDFAAGEDAEVAARLEVHAAAIEGLPEDLVFFAGRGMQRMYLVPSMDLAVVRLGLPPQGRVSEIDWLRELFALPPRPAPPVPAEDGVTVGEGGGL